MARIVWVALPVAELEFRIGAIVMTAEGFTILLEVRRWGRTRARTGILYTSYKQKKSQVHYLNDPVYSELAVSSSRYLDGGGLHCRQQGPPVTCDA